METLRRIQWGILGCGDVCEVKSGPAFNKVNDSVLTAVMRRDGAKAADFARRHNVPKHYSDAQALIEDPEVNAIYIATPPAFHEEYAIQCMNAGKPVYIEKPVSMDAASCERILKHANNTGIKASVAHYRRGLPLFQKIKSLLKEGVIGEPGLVIAQTLQPPSVKLSEPDYWRTTPEISGGGIFFDLAPHQLDIFLWLFGEPRDVHGYSFNQKRRYDAPDLTNVEARYGNVYVHAIWAFNVAEEAETETCEIIGDKGKLVFSFFKPSYIDVVTSRGTETIRLDHPENIQQPMINDVVQFFLGNGPNPCPLEQALTTMRVMDIANNNHGT